MKGRLNSSFSFPYSHLIFEMKDFDYFKEHGTYICVSLESYKDGVNFLVQILTPDPNSPTLYNEKLSTGGWGDNGEFKTWDEAMEFGLKKANELYGISD